MTRAEHDKCIIQTWGAAALFGVVLAILLMIFGVWFLRAIFVGALAFVVLGAILSAIRCEDEPERVNLKDYSVARAETSPETPQPEAPQPDAPLVEAMPVAPVVDPVAAAVAASELAAEPEPVPPAPAGEGTRPAALTEARGGRADDLKKIKGVGPKLEKLLNSMGFFHFDQIAGWTADELAWVDRNLEGFKGRVSRDNWVAQAKLLASGGETDFSKKVDKGGVY